MQPDVVDAEVLRRAQENPADYKPCRCVYQAGMHDL